MLVADATSTCQLRAGDRVLKAARAARTLCGLDALRLPSLAPLPALHTACRRRSAQEATPRGEQRSPWPSFASRLDASSHPGVASCAHAHAAADLTPAAAVPSTSPAWGRDGAWTAPRCRRLPRPCVGLLGQALLRVSPGACRCCPLSLRQRLQPIPPPFPGKGASRPLPSAVPATPSAGTAHGERRWTLRRVKAKSCRAAYGRPRRGIALKRLARPDSRTWPRCHAIGAMQAALRP